ncbi:MAG: plastocyanin/azurin family copper-binding protein [Chloroflexales bacterium]
MKMCMRKITLAVVLGVSLLLSACASGGIAPAASVGTGLVTIELGSDGESLAFTPNALSVSAGQTVTVKMKDNSVAKQHNWVLVKGGVDVAQKVATEGLTVGPDKNYIPSDESNIIAHTSLSSAGQTVEVTFTAPAAGTYAFVCTVPGHNITMRGTLTVNAP